jgi:replication factor A1
MKINELKGGVGNVEIEATVVDKQPTRTVVTKYGKQLTVSSATIKDDTGSITLSLWEKDADAIDVGDKIKVTNGYVSEYKGNPQLSAGKYGKIEVIEKGEGGSSGNSEPEENFGSDSEEF